MKLSYGSQWHATRFCVALERTAQAYYKSDMMSISTDICEN